MAPAKPVHPATIHFPIAFLALSFALDITHKLSPSLPTSITNNLPVSTDLTRLSYFLLSAGLISAVPALITGIREAVVLIARQGMYETDATGYKVQMRTKMKALIAHAVVNDLVMGLTYLVWSRKRAAANDTLAGKLGVGNLAGTGVAAYEAKTWMVVLEGVLFGLLMMGASIGGSLTYIFGVGFAAGGGAKKAQ